MDFLDAEIEDSTKLNKFSMTFYCIVTSSIYEKSYKDYEMLRQAQHDNSYKLT